MNRPPPNLPLFPNPSSSQSQPAVRDGRMGTCNNMREIEKNSAQIRVGLQDSCDEIASAATYIHDATKRRKVITCDHRSEEHTSELQSQSNLVCRLLLEKTNT